MGNIPSVATNNSKTNDDKQKQKQIQTSQMCFASAHVIEETKNNSFKYKFAILYYND